MGLAYSSMMNLGSQAPDFELIDSISARNMSLQELKGEKATIVLFICNHCPYVLHINPALVAIANEYQTKGVAIIAINSNDAVQFPADGLAKMTEMAKEVGYTFPYLYDETQEVAKQYDAVCTPDNFIFNENLELVYRGRLDGTRPGNGIANGNELKGALNALLANQFVSEIQYPSIGCSIKWK